MNPIKNNTNSNKSTSSEPIICRFPIRNCSVESYAESAELVRIFDFEIFAAFGAREKWVKDLHKVLKKNSGNLEIVTHLKFFAQHPSIILSENYFEQYRRWQEILGREVFYESPHLIDRNTIESIAWQVFPQASYLIGDRLSGILDEYLLNKEIDSVNFHELFRYFPFFLREKTLGQNKLKLSTLVWQIARWEWIYCELEYTDLVSTVSLSPCENATTEKLHFALDSESMNFEVSPIDDENSESSLRVIENILQRAIKIQLNPSVYVIKQELDLPSIEKRSGIYAVWGSSSDFKIHERKLDAQSSLVIEILEGEPGMNFGVLLNFLREFKVNEAVSWKALLIDLYAEGLLIV